jgi:hypothetical protein
MSKKSGLNRRTKGRKNSTMRRLCGLGLGLPVVLAGAPAAHALNLYDGRSQGNNREINLDITVSYSGQLRTGKPNQVLVSGINSNGNDGDANFRQGSITDNQFEILPVLDIKNQNFGMHFSGEYYINTVYLGTNSNNQPNSVNPVLNKNTDYASETRQANGHSGQLLDAFVYDSWNFGGDQVFGLKAGQQTLFWGQSLFSTNGISGGQAPIDVLATTQLVNPQAQQVFLPVGQIVATYQPNSVYTIQGYYQYQWEPYNFSGVGSFGSSTDVLGPGGYRIIGTPGGGAPTNFYLLRTKDLSPPSQNGQFGLSVQAQYGNYDIGLYGLRYDAKTPEVYQLAPTGFTPTPGGFAVGQYTAVYPRDIWLYGTSLATTVGATSVAGELSLRTHDPLVGASGLAGSQSAANMGNANNDPLYPVGNVVVGLANAIYGSPALAIDPGGITVVGEFQYVDVIRVTANKDLLEPGRSPDAASIDVSVTPAYFEVLPHLELQFPVSLTYYVAGNSQALTVMNHGTGNFSFGVTATYNNTWDAALSYVGYFGRAGTNPSVPNISASPPDRAYVSLSLQHTF